MSHTLEHALQQLRGDTPTPTPEGDSLDDALRKLRGETQQEVAAPTDGPSLEDALRELRAQPQQRPATKAAPGAPQEPTAVVPPDGERLRRAERGQERLAELGPLAKRFFILVRRLKGVDWASENY